MKTLRSYLAGRWHVPTSGFTLLHDPCTEEPCAQASSAGADLAAALRHAREVGGPVLRALMPSERAALLAACSKVLHEHRDELIELSMSTAGTTRKDAKFDLDGASGTLYYYSTLGEPLSGAVRSDGDGCQVGRSARAWGQHVRVPRHGVAVHINAFNFPAWGFAEKAACALLAGMPVLTKPATSTAVVAERCVELLIERGVLPVGALSLLCGSVGDLLDHLEPQDVVAFTGSADTAQRIRQHPRVVATGARLNVEADSLNAAVLGPDVDEDSDLWRLFIRDVERELTQKSGQKCTAVRRVLAPNHRIEAVQAALVERLGAAVVGNPHDPSVTLGPLATASQLAEAVRGVELLAREAERVLGSGARVDGVGSPRGKGYYFGPTLLRAARVGPGVLHRHEVFGPVATLLPYEGAAEEAARAVALADGTLVTSVYTDDAAWLRTYLLAGGCATGRLYIGSSKAADQAPGSGVALPQLLHGGPGRAGGGEELGGWRGVNLYEQRLALQGDRALIDKLT